MCAKEVTHSADLVRDGIAWPTGWTQCLVPSATGPRCILCLGHEGPHRYWRASKAGIDFDHGHHRLEWA